MKLITPFLSILLIVSCAAAKEKTYIGSTPAGPVIKSFLGIPLSDSVDFIRWKFIPGNNRYYLQCNYGIGKPNTNSFINGGTKIELRGECRKEKNYYQLRNGPKTLRVAELNENLLHFSNAENSLLVGNSGWSYTLSNISPSGTDQINIRAVPTVLKDSISFQGRTPCN